MLWTGAARPQHPTPCIIERIHFYSTGFVL
jgi:hypothetical protein